MLLALNTYISDANTKLAVQHRLTRLEKEFLDIASYFSIANSYYLSCSKMSPANHPQYHKKQTGRDTREESQYWSHGTSLDTRSNHLLSQIIPLYVNSAYAS